MDLLGVQKDLDTMGAQLTSALARIADLEAQTAKDVDAIADKLIAALLPEAQAARASVDQLTVVCSASVTEVLALARRIDGAALSFKLAPETPA